MSDYFLDNNGVPMLRLSPITARQVTNFIRELNEQQARIKELEAVAVAALPFTKTTSPLSKVLEKALRAAGYLGAGVDQAT